ncbi:MAG: hypothetical protein GF313_15970 [Caldithrix sp.]|nr:hypothetical protein [Caldithrix sp.]
MQYFLGGMGIRFLLVIATIFIVLKFTAIDTFVFIFALFVLYFLFQIWEVVLIQWHFKED